MNAAVEVGTVSAPSHSSSRAWRRGLLAVSIGTVGVLVGIGASELANGSADTVPPAAVVEAEVPPTGGPAVLPEPTERPDLSRMSPDAAARWLENPTSTDRSDQSRGMSDRGGKFWR